MIKFKTKNLKDPSKWKMFDKFSENFESKQDHTLSISVPSKQSAWHRAAKQRRFAECGRTEGLGGSICMVKCTTTFRADTVLDSFYLSLQLPFPPQLCVPGWPNWTTWMSSRLLRHPSGGTANGKYCQEVWGQEETEAWVLILSVPPVGFLSGFRPSSKGHRCCKVAFSTHCLSFWLSVSPPQLHLTLWAWGGG